MRKNKIKVCNDGRFTFLFCPGMQKAGTTYLFNLLNQLDEVCFSIKKEVHFFGRDETYEKGIDFFYNRFEPSDDTLYLADFTPSYLLKDSTMERIRLHIGDNARFIIMLRDPIKRAFSNYRMLLVQGYENRSFHEVVESLLKDDSEGWVLRRGRYSEQLDRFFRYYSADMAIIEEFGAFVRNPSVTVGRVCDFLGISGYEGINYRVGRHSGTDRRIAGLGKVLYDIPREKKEFIYRNRLLNFIYRGIVYVTRRKMKVEPVLEQRTIELLKDYYEESNRILKEKYGVDTSGWL